MRPELMIVYRLKPLWLVV